MLRRRRSGRRRQNKRPFGVTLCAILEIIAAIYVFLGVAAFSSIRLYEISGIVGIIAGFGDIILLVSGIVLLLSAYGFWHGSRWGWWLGIIISGVLILSIALLDIIGLVIGIVLVFYLTRANVKKWFKVS
ncbi:MAG: hypothetical protein ACREBH_03420 [Candidatus Micrarchaeaceae archaeon]